MKNKKVFVLTGILVLVSFALAAVISIRSLDKIISSYQKELTVSVMNQIYNDIRIELSNPIVASLTMSNDYFLKLYLEDEDFPKTVDDEQKIVSYLDSIKNGLGYNTAFVVSNKNGNYYTMNGFNKTVRPDMDDHDIWYKNFVDSGRTYDFDVDVDEVHNNQLSVFVNTRVENQNKELIGVCGVGIDMTYLQDIFRNYEEANGIKVNLVDRNGLVQVDTDVNNIEKQVLFDLIKDYDAGDEYIYINLDNGGYVVTKYIDSFGWYLVVTCENDNTQLYNEMFTELGIAFLGILLALLLFMYLVIYEDRRKLEKGSITDGLTGLYNKTYFIEEATARSQKDINLPYAFIFIDMDHFKDVNDKLSHAIGDEAIITVSKIIKEVFNTNALVGRFGGDEFVVFLNNTDEDTLVNKLKQINDKARITLTDDQTKVRISASIGAIYSEKKADDISYLMDLADQELYKSKEMGRDTYNLKKI